MFKVGDYVYAEKNNDGLTFKGIIQEIKGNEYLIMGVDVCVFGWHTEDELKLVNNTFEPNKTATELGIDLTRKFRVVVENLMWSVKIGDILEIDLDDTSEKPYFWNLTANRSNREKHPTEEKWACCAYWSQLEYADEVYAEKNDVTDYVFLCETSEDWDNICEWLENNTNYKWASGANPTKLENGWETYGTDTYIVVDVGKGDRLIHFGTTKWSGAEYNNNRKFVSVKAFLNNKSLINNNKTMENPLTTFSQIFMGEPRKSRTKAGILDDRGVITDNGAKVVLTYLLDKGNLENFDKEVVECICEEIDKKSCCNC